MDGPSALSVGARGKERAGVAMTGFYSLLRRAPTGGGSKEQTRNWREADGTLESGDPLPRPHRSPHKRAELRKGMVGDGALSAVTGAATGSRNSSRHLSRGQQRRGCSRYLASKAGNEAGMPAALGDDLH